MLTAAAKAKAQTDDKRMEVSYAQKTEETLKRIKSRRKALQKIAKELKGDFVGLDEIIDEIIRNIEVWYVMPEVITRPVIVNLWGMTGVGKTDLVRRLVRGKS
jgi:ATP-dependent Clp protease ATP-binding subunit ClpA